MDAISLWLAAWTETGLWLALTAAVPAALAWAILKND